MEENAPAAQRGFQTRDNSITEGISGVQMTLVIKMLKRPVLILFHFVH